MWMIRTLLIALVATLAIGCSKAEMTLQLSVYTGDLGLDKSEFALNSYDLGRILQSLKNYEGLAEKVTKNRTDLADEALKLIQLKCMVIHETDHPGTTGSIDNREPSNCFETGQDEKKADFVETLEKKKNEFVNYIDGIRYRVERYKASLEGDAKGQNMASLRKETYAIISDMHSAEDKLQELSGALGTKYERTINNLGSIVELAKQKDQKTPSFPKLQQTIERIATLSNAKIDTFDKASEALDAKRNNMSLLQVAVTNQEEATVNRISHAINIRNTQLYKMQDPADPIWKKVVDEKNESLWNLLKNETHASAEGKAEIIMVQDTPMLHRVQQLHGDPSTMIESQLIISRAVGAAAIEIAGKAAGIDMDLMSSISAPKANGANKPLEYADSSASAKARLEILKDDYKTAKAKLIAKLEALTAELAAAETTGIAAVETKIKGALEGHRIEFETIAKKD